MRRPVVVAVVVGGLACGAYLLFGVKPDAAIRPSRVADAASDDPGTAPIRVATTDEDGDPRTDRTAPQETEPAPPTTESSRTTVPTAALAGRIVDELGAPLPNAVVTWSVVPNELTTGAIDLDALHELVRPYEAKTDTDGLWAFHARPNGVDEMPSALWITHLEHAARVVRIAPALDGWTHGLDWALERADPIAVRVVDSAGRGLPEASVEQQGLTLHDGSGELPGRLAWLLRRRLETNERGRTFAFPAPARQRLVARHDDRLSAPWEGVPAGELTLTVGTEFSVAGDLNWTAGAESASITCEAVEGARRTLLGSTDVAAGPWGPVAYALTGAAEYLFRLEGPGIVPVEHLLPAPEAGALVHLDFDVEEGHVLWFYVTDAGGNVLFDAEATVEWSVDGRTVSRRAKTREDGYLPVFGCASGTVYPKIDCPGYARFQARPVDLPLPEQGVFPITLTRAGILRGTVLANGQPADSFEVLAWPSLEPGTMKTHVFDRDAEGAFELDDVPLGAVHVMATRSGYSPSIAREVTLTADAPVEVTLELTPSVRAVGRVVDDATGEPVREAVVRVQQMAGIARLDSAGPPCPVNQDGRFEVAGVAPGHAALSITAPGYSTQTPQRGFADDDVIDMGVVRLHRRQSATVRLLTDGATDPTACSLQAKGPDGVANLRFDEEGIVRMESVSAGMHFFFVMTPDGTILHQPREFVPGDDWDVVFDLAGEAQLEIRAFLEDGRPVPQFSFARIVGFSQTWQSDTAYSFDAEGRVQARLPLDTYNVEIRPETGSALLASRRIDLDEPGLRSITIRLGDEGRRIRVVDTAGDPLEGVEILLHLPGRADVWQMDRKTDADGTTEVHGLGPDATYATGYLVHRTGATRIEVPVPLAPAGETSEIVFADGTRAEFVLLRPDGPAAGVLTGLSGPQRLRVALAPASDDLGRVVWDDVSAGELTFVVRDGKYWHSKTSVSVVPGGAPTTIEVFRLADLTCEATAEGLPVAGVDLAIQRIGGSTPLADFVASGRVASSTGSLTTDSTGTVVLEGLAEGRYEWLATSPEGVEASGVVEVVPDTTNRIRAAF